MAAARLAALAFAVLAAHHAAHAAYTDGALLTGLTEPVFVSFDGAGHTLVRAPPPPPSLRLRAAPPTRRPDSAPLAVLLCRLQRRPA